LEKPGDVCAKCDQHYLRYVGRPVVVVACEGAGIRGEVARRAAVLLCNDLFPRETARLCLGASFSYEGGPRKVARYAPLTLVLDGCSIQCGSRVLRSAVKGISTVNLMADRLYRFNRELVEIREMPSAEIDRHALTVARKAAARIREFLKKYRKY